MSHEQEMKTSRAKRRSGGSVWSRGLILAILMGLLLAACGDGESADTTEGEPGTETTAASGGDETTTTAGEEPAEPLHLRWAVSSSPDTLFAPTYFNSPIGSGIMGLIQDNLLVYTGEGELVESVAESWEATSDTTYVYTVREGIQFSDGTPLTAEDVAFSFAMQADPDFGSKQSFLFENVESVTTDGNDVIVELKQPDSSWQYMPTHMGAYIYNKADVEANVDSYGTPEHFPLGTGPYMVEEFVPDSHVLLVRNPNYWGEAPPFETVRFDVIPDDQTRLLAMQSGEIDGTFNVPATAIEQWEQAANIVDATAFIFRGLTIDMEDDPFDDIHVRRALYYATDREAIVNGLFPGEAVAATTLDPPAMFEGVLPADEVAAGYDELEVFEFDLDKAREELAQSKVPDGFEMTINVPDGSQAAINITQAIKETWAQIGVDVELNLMPGGPRFQIILDHEPNLGVQIIGNLPDLPDPVILPYIYYHSSQAAVNGNNSSNLRDDAVDGLLEEAKSATDPQAAARAALEAQIVASEQVPIIPILWSDFRWAVRSDWSMGPVNGFSVSHNFVDIIDPS